MQKFEGLDSSVGRTIGIRGTYLKVDSSVGRTIGIRGTYVKVDSSVGRTIGIRGTYLKVVGSSPAPGTSLLIFELPLH